MLCQRKPEQTEIDEKKVAQDHCRPIADGREREEVERPNHCKRADAECSAGNRAVQFTAPFEGNCREQKQNFERQKHSHWNECFLSGEVLFPKKEIPDPRDL